MHRRLIVALRNIYKVVEAREYHNRDLKQLDVLQF